jgi:hypothetical protein
MQATFMPASPKHCFRLPGVEFHDVGVPGTSQIDVIDAALVEHAHLYFGIRVDFVGKCTDDGHVLLLFFLTPNCRQPSLVSPGGV